MVEEELREQAQALAVDLCARAVDLVQRELVRLGQLQFDAGGGQRRRGGTVDAGAGRALALDAREVAHVRRALLEVLEAVRADKEALLLGECIGVWRKVPGIDFVGAHLNDLDVLDLGRLLVLLLQRLVRHRLYVVCHVDLSLHVASRTPRAKAVGASRRSTSATSARAARAAARRGRRCRCCHELRRPYPVVEPPVCPLKMNIVAPRAIGLLSPLDDLYGAGRGVGGLAQAGGDRTDLERVLQLRRRRRLCLRRARHHEAAGRALERKSACQARRPLLDGETTSVTLVRFMCGAFVPVTHTR